LYCSNLINKYLSHEQVTSYPDSAQPLILFTVKINLRSGLLNGPQASRARIQDLYDDVYLQTWTNGATRRYWTVRKDGRIIRPVAGRVAEEHLQSVYKRESSVEEDNDSAADGENDGDSDESSDREDDEDNDDPVYDEDDDDNISSNGGEDADEDGHTG
jgi:hypothetical protein